ncbi:hypothetical protein C8R45DRAFT_1076629 [Mycena sanguinolenta]|nr:hypothetical protein C8R45DRAFT_1076629 [Mycena sanguinolenta]
MKVDEESDGGVVLVDAEEENAEQRKEEDEGEEAQEAAVSGMLYQISMLAVDEHMGAEGQEQRGAGGGEEDRGLMEAGVNATDANNLRRPSVAYLKYAADEPTGKANGPELKAQQKRRNPEVQIADGRRGTQTEVRRTKSARSVSEIRQAVSEIRQVGTEVERIIAQILLRVGVARRLHDGTRRKLNIFDSMHTKRKKRGAVVACESTASYETVSQVGEESADAMQKRKTHVAASVCVSQLFIAGTRFTAFKNSNHSTSVEVVDCLGNQKRPLFRTLRLYYGNTDWTASLMRPSSPASCSPKANNQGIHNLRGRQAGNTHIGKLHSHRASRVGGYYIVTLAFGVDWRISCFNQCSWTFFLSITYSPF